MQPNMAGYFYNSTSKNTQPYWLGSNRLKKCLSCLLYNCFLLILIKSSFFFIQTKSHDARIHKRQFFQTRGVVSIPVENGRFIRSGLWLAVGARPSLHFPTFSGLLTNWRQLFLEHLCVSMVNPGTFRMFSFAPRLANPANSWGFCLIKFVLPRI